MSNIPYCICQLYSVGLSSTKIQMMAKVIVTTEVEDASKWEEGFRTHVELFRTYTINKPIHFNGNDNNEVAILFEPDDLDKFLASMDAPETAEAMAYDGVKRETVKVYVLDKELQI